MSDSLQPCELQQARLLCPPLSPAVCSNSYPLRQGCYLTNSSSAPIVSFCLQSFPASGSFPMSWLFALGGQSIGASDPASAFPVNIQDWFLLAQTGLICLKHSRDFSRIIWKYQFFSTQPFFMVQLSPPYSMTTRKTIALLYGQL